MQSLEAFLHNECASPIQAVASRDPRTGNLILTLTGGDDGKVATFLVIGNMVQPQAGQ